MFVIDLPTIQKHVTDHIKKYSRYSPLGTPAELLNEEKRRDIMNKEMHYLLSHKQLRTNSFQPFYERMIRDAVGRGWTPPESRVTRFQMNNPCAEIPLGTPQFTVIDGHHRLAALAAMGTMGLGGSPYPLHIHNTQHRHICRELWKIIYPVHRETPIALMLGVRELNGKKVAQLLRMAGHTLMMQLIYGFYNEKRHMQWWLWIRQMASQFTNEENRAEYARIASNLILDAAGLGKDKAFPATYRTSTVMNMLKGMKADDDYTRFPILADALEEAGFDDPHVLQNYRDPMANHSGGSWIFRKVGLS